MKEEIYIDSDGHELTKKTLYNGTEEWYKDGKLHRLDGPACVYSDGSEEWYKDGKRYRLMDRLVFDLMEQKHIG